MMLGLQVERPREPALASSRIDDECAAPGSRWRLNASNSIAPDDWMQLSARPDDHCLRPWDAADWPAGSMPIADAGAYAYAHSSIDQAARAITELLGPVLGAQAFATFPGPPLDKIGL